MKFIKISNFPQERIYVLLSEKYRKFLIEKSMKKLTCKNYFELSLWINKTFKTKFNGGDVKYWIEGKRGDKRTNKIHPKFMPLWLVQRLSKLNKEKIEGIQRNVISYRSGGSGLIINSPKLPIKVTPELDSIVIHLLGDGAAGDFTPSYTQKNKQPFDNFIEKLENCFGNFQKSIYFTQGKHQIKFPKAITDIISKHYSIISYRSHDSKIPNAILNRRDTKYKLACIASFIVDEGNIRDIIVLYSSNRILLSQIRQLVLDCGYNCTKIKLNKKANSYMFGLRNKDIEKFYNDLIKLSKEFSTCNLSFKDKDAKFILERRKNKNPKSSKITDKIILNILKKDSFSAKQISRLSGYAYCTILHHLEKLYKNKRITRKKNQDRIYLWKLCGILEKIKILD